MEIEQLRQKKKELENDISIFVAHKFNQFAQNTGVGIKRINLSILTASSVGRDDEYITDKTTIDLDI